MVSLSRISQSHMDHLTFEDSACVVLERYAEQLLPLLRVLFYFFFIYMLLLVKLLFCKCKF